MSNITTFRGGPAYLVWNGITWKMRDDWKVSNPDQFFDIPSATGVGNSKGVSDKMGKISFTPKIFVSGLAAQLAALFPYSTPAYSKLLRPASDLPAVIHARNGGTSNLGLTATLYAAMLTKQPKLTFAPDKPLVDSVELTYLQALGTNVGDAASLVGTASATYSEPVFTPADELFDRYTLALGYAGTLAATTTSTSPTVGVTSTAGLLVGQAVTGTGIPANTTILAIASATTLTLSANATATGSPTLTFAPVTIVTDKEGIAFEPGCPMEAIKPSQEPTRDFRQGIITGKLSFRPHNMDVDDFYATYFPEVGQALGQSIEQLGCMATVTGAKTGGAGVGGVNLLLPMVTREKSGHDFSGKNPRTEKVELDVIQTVSGGAWQPLFTLGVNA